jgi:lipopolysaccharide transport system permease protein
MRDGNLDMQELLIEPGRTELHYWRDLWRFRELLYFLSQRDILVRYKQTAIGIAWAVLRPVLTTAVFVAFRLMTKRANHGIPDVLIVFAALVPWQFFSNSLTESSMSLIGNANLISKIYFPRVLIPASSVTTGLIDFAIMLGLLGVLMGWYQFAPGWQILLLPVLTLQTFALAIGIGLLLAALNVEYRDFRYIVPFVVQFGLFISPIAFETSAVSARWRLLYSLNPLAGIIDGYRWAILRGKTPIDPQTMLVSIVITITFLVLGFWYFRRTERSFADVI